MNKKKNAYYLATVVINVHVIGCDGFGQNQSVYVVRHSSQDPDQLNLSLREYKLGHTYKDLLWKDTRSMNVI